MPAAMGTKLSSSYRRVMHAHGAATIFNGVLPHTYVAQRKKKNKKKHTQNFISFILFFLEMPYTVKFKNCPWIEPCLPFFYCFFPFLISVRGICSASLSSRKCPRGNSLSRCDTDLNCGTWSSVYVVQCSPLSCSGSCLPRGHC